MPRRLIRVGLVALACVVLSGDAGADPPPWQVCTMMLPGVAGAPPYFRNCRPIPAACVATPTCACLAQHLSARFRYGCIRRGHRFIRQTIALP